jgi:hypothetical protein
MSEKLSNSRSEEVRERRTREQTKRQKQAGERAYRPLPPVTSRSRGSYTTPRQARKMGDRRFHAALVLPQDHVQIPSLRNLRMEPRLFSGMLAIALLAALYALWSAPAFRVSQPQVTGLSRLSPEEIGSGAGINGEMIFLLRPDEVATQLRLKFPELASTQVKIAFPNLVHIQATEREPVLLWQQGEGYTWIDASGVAFHPHGEAPGLVPVLASDAPPSNPEAADDPLNPPAFLAPDMVKTALALAPIVPAGNTLTYDPKYGLGWTDSRGWQVFFGTTSKDMALKMRVYQSLVDSLAGRGITPVFISMIHADAPYYRMAQ